MRTLIFLAVVVFLCAIVYPRFVRPWHLRWGATTHELRAALPGDELVPHAKLRATHAITISAPVSEVWPWIVQIGQGRGGFYSYEWLENLFGCDIRNAERILPQFQTLKSGEGIRLHPKAPAFPVAEVLPNKMLLLGAKAGSNAAPTSAMSASWGFYLRKISSDETRLVVRFQADWKPSWPATIGYRGFLEPIHFIMERKMLLGIRNRAEALHDELKARANNL
jgi:hypothetical protein